MNTLYKNTTIQYTDVLIAIKIDFFVDFFPIFLVFTQSIDQRHM